MYEEPLCVKNLVCEEFIIVQTGKRLAYGTGRNEELKLCYFCSEIHPRHVKELKLWRINQRTIKPENLDSGERAHSLDSRKSNMKP